MGMKACNLDGMGKENAFSVLLGDGIHLTEHDFSGCILVPRTSGDRKTGKYYK
jgi:hypothetical protein